MTQPKTKPCVEYAYGCAPAEEAALRRRLDVIEQTLVDHGYVRRNTSGPVLRHLLTRGQPPAEAFHGLEWLRTVPELKYTVQTVALHLRLTVEKVEPSAHNRTRFPNALVAYLFCHSRRELTAASLSGSTGSLTAATLCAKDRERRAAIDGVLRSV